MSDLHRLVTQLQELTGDIQKSEALGHYLPQSSNAELRSIMTAAITISIRELGERNAFSASLQEVLEVASSSFAEGASAVTLEEAIELVRQASEEIDRWTSGDTSMNIRNDSITSASFFSLADDFQHWEQEANRLAMADGLSISQAPAVQALMVEARTLISEHLGRGSPFYSPFCAVWAGHKGRPRAPTKYELARYAQLMRAAGRQVARTQRSDRDVTAPAPLSPYVDPVTVEAIKRLSHPQYDLRKLVALCEELNIVSARNAYLALGALLRMILDHVPPIFGFQNFAQVTSSYAGGKSFKAHMQHLDSSSRKVSDGIIHGMARNRDVLPGPLQVDFRAALAELLNEIIRIVETATVKP